MVIWRDTRVEKGKDHGGWGNPHGKMLMRSIKRFSQV